MRQRLRVPVPRVFLVLAIVGFLSSDPALSSGFQVMTHGARATGMGLAYAGIGGDPTAIFYNPAGIGWMTHMETYVGANFLTRTDGGVVGANPFPGEGVTANIDKQWFFVPDGYAVLPLTNELNFGIGGFAHYGLGLRWEDPENAPTRFVSQNAVVRSLDVNPVFSYRLFPQLAIAVGADYRFSKVQLERNQALFDPFTQSFVDVAHIKLNSDLLSNGGWGWNAGIMFKPFEGLSLGAAYRSSITIDYEGDATFTQRVTGNPVIDGQVAASLPTGNSPVLTSIKFPSSINIGAGIQLPAGFLLGLEADWTEWSTFQELNIIFPTLTGRDLNRVTNWEDSWAYRVGLEKAFGQFAIRVGYYYDNTPQPDFDVGPLLSDSDRNVYTAGFGYNTERFGFDVGAALIKFKERSIFDNVAQTDNFFGTYTETGLVLSAGLRLAL